MSFSLSVASLKLINDWLSLTEYLQKNNYNSVRLVTDLHIIGAFYYSN